MLSCVSAPLPAEGFNAENFSQINGGVFWYHIIMSLCPRQIERFDRVLRDVQSLASHSASALHKCWWGNNGRRWNIVVGLSYEFI